MSKKHPRRKRSMEESKDNVRRFFTVSHPERGQPVFGTSDEDCYGLWFDTREDGEKLLAHPVMAKWEGCEIIEMDIPFLIFWLEKLQRNKVRWVRQFPILTPGVEIEPLLAALKKLV